MEEARYSRSAVLDDEERSESDRCIIIILCCCWLLYSVASWLTAKKIMILVDNERDLATEIEEAARLLSQQARNQSNDVF